MNKHLFYLIVLLLPLLSRATAPDTITVDGHSLLYHITTSDKADKKGVIIYMHGGVSQFKGLQTPKSISLDNMFEGNTVFLPTVLATGYDVITPIAYNEYNWLEEGGVKFITELVNKHAANYQEVIISGFSDGGTGAFRIFYQHPELFAGLWMFNGYPQHKNYYKTVDHYKGMGKHIIFYATESDKVIPYEFPLLEYRRQKILNEHTYFYLRAGSHSFKEYTQEDIEQGINILSLKTETASSGDEIKVYPPIDGFVLNGVIKELYPFKSKIGKRYSVAEQDNNRDDYNYKKISKLLNEYTISLQPITINKNELNNKDNLVFAAIVNGKKEEWTLINWLNKKPF